MKTKIIAEAGVNHNGDIGIAKELISAAKESGADIIKFQTFKASNLLTKTAPKALYQKKTTNSSESQYDMISKLELSKDDHLELIEECFNKNIEFLSTAFDKDSFDMLIDLGIKQIKIPSGEIINLPLLKQMAKHNLPILISTGMANMSEVRDALEIIEKCGTSRSKITVMHCTTEYPTPMEDVNLMAMKKMKSELNINVGYSDHTEGIEVATSAVALGATVIEKHFTLDKNLPGPDHMASIEPSQLKEMINSIRNIEVALGNGIKKPNKAELLNKLIVRKSIVATKIIRTGEVFTQNNIGCKRPGHGISPMRWEEVIGQKAKKNFVEDQLIEI